MAAHAGLQARGAKAGSAALASDTMVRVTFPVDADLQSLIAAPFRVATQNSRSEVVGWTPRLTPPLPQPWPQPQGACVFAYATALPIVIRGGAAVLTAMDATLVSEPFAVVLIRAGEPLTTSVLATVLRCAGTQGIGPASARELTLLKRRDEIYAELYGAVTPFSALAEEYILQWVRSNGVVARCLPAAQQGFLTALGANLG